MNRDQSAPAVAASAQDHAGVDSNTRFLAAGLLLGTALLAGGRNGALNHLLVQLAALPLLYLLLRDWAAIRLTWSARFALVALALAALQLVPLPPMLWMALPGGATASTALDLAGIEPVWRPLALDPQAAAMALASLVAPLVLYIGATTLTAEERRKLLVATAIFAGASALLGLVQKLTGTACLFDGGHCGQSTGLMIN